MDANKVIISTIAEWERLAEEHEAFAADYRAKIQHIADLIESAGNGKSNKANFLSLSSGPTPISRPGPEISMPQAIKKMIRLAPSGLTTTQIVEELEKQGFTSQAKSGMRAVVHANLYKLKKKGRIKPRGKGRKQKYIILEKSIGEQTSIN